MLLDCEMFETCRLERQPHAGSIVVELQLATRGRATSPSKMYQNNSLPTSISVCGKYSAIGEANELMTTCRLCIWPPCGMTSIAFGPGHRADLAGFGEAADAIRVELKDVEGAGTEQIVEAEAREFVFAAGERDVGALFELGELMNLVGKQQLLDPSGVKRLEPLEQPLGVGIVEAHVGTRP